MCVSVGSAYDDSGLRELEGVVRCGSSVNEFRFVHSRRDIFVRLTSILVKTVGCGLECRGKRIRKEIETGVGLVRGVGGRDGVDLGAAAPGFEGGFGLFFVTLG